MKVLPIVAHLLELTLPNCPNLLKLVAVSNGVSVNCMLDSGAMHSFVHPRIVQTTEAQPSEGAVLTVTVANASKALYNVVLTLDLMFMVEGEDRQVTVLLQLYVLDGLQSNVILGMDILKWYNSLIS